MKDLKNLFSVLIEKIGIQCMIYISLLLLSLIFAGYSVYRQNTLGLSEDDWVEGCAGGQKVMIAKFITKGLAVNKLDLETGKPIPCEK